MSWANRQEPKYIEGPHLKSWQQDAYRWYKNNQTGGVLVVKSCRQVGKSFLLSILALKTSLEYKNSSTYFISPTLNQSREVFKNIVQYIRDIPCYENINNQTLTITFNNGSSINFKSAQQREALRGFTCKGKGLLIFDEAAFLGEDIFALCLPYTNVNNNSIIYASTPLFKSGTFYELYNDADKVGVTTIDTGDYDLSMFLPEEKKDFYRKTMSTQQFNAEILGQFIEEYSGVFGDFSGVIGNEVDASNSYYIGIDWGSGQGGDYTAISVFNHHKQQVDLSYFNDKDVEQTMDEVCRMVDKWHPKKLTVEKNSIGSVFGDLLRRRVSMPVTFFVTNNDTKNKIINKLQVGIQNRTIQLLDDKEQKMQLAMYQVESTPTGKVTYNAQRGSHDDIVIADAIALNSIDAGHIDIR